MTLRLFSDAVSPSCRAIVILLEKEALACDYVTIDLFQGEQKTNEEFGSVCPVRKVPAIDDKGFHLFER